MFFIHVKIFYVCCFVVSLSLSKGMTVIKNIYYTKMWLQSLTFFLYLQLSFFLISHLIFFYYYDFVSFFMFPSHLTSIISKIIHFTTEFTTEFSEVHRKKQTLNFLWIPKINSSIFLLNLLYLFFLFHLSLAPHNLFVQFLTQLLKYKKKL